MMTKQIGFKIFLSIFILLFGMTGLLHADEEEKLPIPRFVSLKSNKVNVRVGPKQDYPIRWVYHRQGLPVEIIQEFDTWRKIRDVEGEEGWIASSLLTGTRTMIVAPWNKDKNQTITLYSDPSNSSAAVAYLEPGVIGKIYNCNGSWCRISTNGKKGWVEQSSIWGVYPNEIFSK